MRRVTPAPRAVPRAGRRWGTSPERAALLAIYAEADALVRGWACRCAEPGSGPPDCCHFAVTGREPYPTTVEVEEILHGVRARGAPRPGRRHLPTSPDRACPLLSAEGRCTVYAHRPLGCRTFFCDDASPALGATRLPRQELQELGRRIASLSAAFAPHDPHPRPLVRALACVVPRSRPPR